ncbi:hypothetical protein CAPTEDRAFT_198195 [Capitella teleta]|uniref:Uncharacterized protein n=1 Tax=Capitella teleta TaxID=283909 RepID=X1ZYD2_CAPTE|nr:hypothetical protein CAPTEDRAFT_198195 [Capitella teleta]|eukprot:ELU04734.1 hypothetical protein CAPTEDRAFT_198195 [Capitella teleta]
MTVFLKLILKPTTNHRRTETLLIRKAHSKKNLHQGVIMLFYLQACGQSGCGGIRDIRDLVLKDVRIQGSIFRIDRVHTKWRIRSPATSSAKKRKISSLSKDEEHEMDYAHFNLAERHCFNVLKFFYEDTFTRRSQKNASCTSEGFLSKPKKKFHLHTSWKTLDPVTTCEKTLTPTQPSVSPGEEATANTR